MGKPGRARSHRDFLTSTARRRLAGEPRARRDLAHARPSGAARCWRRRSHL